MITINATTAIERLFEKSVHENALCSPEEHCLVTRHGGATPPGADAKNPLVVLNISSYLFRIVALFEFNTDAAMVERLARITRSPNQKLAGQAQLDAYAELANMICGSVNRSLCQQFRHAGISTPYFLENSCSQYLAMLKPAQTQMFEVSINAALWFKLAVCTCVADDAMLDFSLDESVQLESQSGELELF